VHRFVAESELAQRAHEVGAWHARPGALERLLPPWLAVRVIKPGELREGARTTLALGPESLGLRFESEHRDVEPGAGFRDVQVEGPFAEWAHLHRFLERGERTVLRDEIIYQLPGGRAGEVFAAFARRALGRIFRFRHLRTRHDLERHHALAPAPPLRIALTGATGLIGSALRAYLRGAGHEVRRVTRRPQDPDDIGWDPRHDQLDEPALDGTDAVIHLAGENLFGLGWSEAKKRAILESRVRSTRLLAERLSERARRGSAGPRTLLVASAVGYYGDRGGERLLESSAPGEGFLARVCRDWEAAADPAREAGVRVATVRTGVVLSARGGALRLMHAPFALGLGGRLGEGSQHMSWIALDDLLAIYELLLQRDELAGAFNAAAPEALTNLEFTRTLARVLRRPALAPVPRPALRALLGELADEMLLASQRMVPQRLEQGGFRFLFPEAELALRMELGRLRPSDCAVRLEAD
jgi:hypothetical protein